MQPLPPGVQPGAEDVEVLVGRADEGDERDRALRGVIGRLHPGATESGTDHPDRGEDPARLDRRPQAHVAAVGDSGQIHPVRIRRPHLHQVHDEGAQEPDIVRGTTADQGVEATVDTVRIRHKKVGLIGAPINTDRLAYLLAGAGIEMQRDDQRQPLSRPVAGRGVQQVLVGIGAEGERERVITRCRRLGRRLSRRRARRMRPAGRPVAAHCPARPDRGDKAQDEPDR